MIEKRLFLEMEKKWQKYHAVYQRWNRIETRFPMFLKHIKCLKGKNVLELACNAGVYGYEIAKIAKSYIGIDQGEEYIKQAMVTKKYIENPDVQYVRRPVKGYIRDLQKDVRNDKINAIFSSFALYHFSTKEVDMISEYLLPKCDVCYIITRTKKRTPMRKYNKYKFWNPENVSKWMKAAGFETKIEWNGDKKFAAIVGLKPAKAKRTRRPKNVEDNRNSERSEEASSSSSEGQSTQGIDGRWTDKRYKRDVA